jgi:hypothetical protein
MESFRRNIPCVKNILFSFEVKEEWREKFRGDVAYALIM